jgi:hypothetical protein
MERFLGQFSPYLYAVMRIVVGMLQGAGPMQQQPSMGGAPMIDHGPMPMPAPAMQSPAMMGADEPF